MSSIFFTFSKKYDPEFFRGLVLYAFNSNGNKGIACGLGNIQKVKDGEILGGRTSASDDFETLEDEDFLA